MKQAKTHGLERWSKKSAGSARAKNIQPAKEREFGTACAKLSHLAYGSVS